VDSTVVKYKNTSVLRERIHLWKLKIIIRQAMKQKKILTTSSTINSRKSSPSIDPGTTQVLTYPSTLIAATML
jgi:hypothetical protein